MDVKRAARGKQAALSAVRVLLLECGWEWWNLVLVVGAVVGVVVVENQADGMRQACCVFIE